MNLFFYVALAFVAALSIYNFYLVQQLKQTGSRDALSIGNPISGQQPTNSSATTTNYVVGGVSSTVDMEAVKQLELLNKEEFASDEITIEQDVNQILEQIDQIKQSSSG